MINYIFNNRVMLFNLIIPLLFLIFNFQLSNFIKNQRLLIVLKY